MAKRQRLSERRSGNDAGRKQRTREHIIADLSVNHLERLALTCGFTVQRQFPDYGYDLRLETFDEKGEIEGEHVSLQLKATEHVARYESTREEWFSVPISVKDYGLWREALMPVYLILYDAVMQEAYWVHIQDYDNTHRPTVEGDTINVRILHGHVLGVQTIRMMRRRKQAIVHAIKHTQEKSPRPQGR